MVDCPCPARREIRSRSREAEPQRRHRPPRRGDRRMVFRGTTFHPRTGAQQPPHRPPTEAPGHPYPAPRATHDPRPHQQQRISPRGTGSPMQSLPHRHRNASPHHRGERRQTLPHRETENLAARKGTKSERESLTFPHNRVRQSVSPSCLHTRNVGHRYQILIAILTLIHSSNSSLLEIFLHSPTLETCRLAQ